MPKAVKTNEEWKQLFFERFEISEDAKTLVYKVKPSKRMKKGDIVGSPDKDGYYRASVDRTHINVHRIVACMFLGLDISNQKILVDHINGDKTDNRVENLRLVSVRGNGLNQERHRNGSLAGASKTESGKFRANIHIDGRVFNLGQFESPEESNAVYQSVCGAVERGESVDLLQTRCDSIPFGRGTRHGRKDTHSWYAVLNVDKKRYRLGSWPTQEEAFEVYKEAWLELHRTGTVDTKKYIERSRKGHLTGTSFNKAQQRWIAQIRVDGKTVHIGGTYDTAEEAHAAYLSYKRRNGIE